jgi:hypothetical protein
LNDFGGQSPICQGIRRVANAVEASLQRHGILASYLCPFNGISHLALRCNDSGWRNGGSRREANDEVVVVCSHLGEPEFGNEAHEFIAARSMNPCRTKFNWSAKCATRGHAPAESISCVEDQHLMAKLAKSLCSAQSG